MENVLYVAFATTEIIIRFTPMRIITCTVITLYVMVAGKLLTDMDMQVGVTTHTLETHV